MESESKTCLRVLEFYSGIGGMRFSLNQSGIQATVVEAFDINNIANEVYKHNFGHSPYQGNIQSLTASQLDKFKADAWLLSPPCQPYTRQGLQKDANDARASSFLKLIELIPMLIFPPSFLFLENVVGFESSITHGKMMEVLEQNGFATQEFILTPLQFGIPYSRPRYFCLAKRAPFLFQSQELNGKLVFDVAPLMPKKVSCLNEKKLVDADEESERDECLDTSASCKSVKDFIEVDVFGFDSEGGPPAYNIAEEEMLVEEGSDIFEDLPTNKNLISEDRKIDQGIYSVPLQLIERWGDAMDIVFPNSKRCCCFTKSYGRYVKGTGSFLAIHKVSPNTSFIGERTQNDLMQKKSFIQDSYVRYFTPREIANFHSFPDDFSFPSHVSQRQRYALLGNSISVAVVAPLLRYLFTTQCTDF